MDCGLAPVSCEGTGWTNLAQRSKRPELSEKAIRGQAGGKWVSLQLGATCIIISEDSLTLTESWHKGEKLHIRLMIMNYASSSDAWKPKKSSKLPLSLVCTEKVIFFSIHHSNFASLCITRITKGKKAWEQQTNTACKQYVQSASVPYFLDPSIYLFQAWIC